MRLLDVGSPREPSSIILSQSFAFKLSLPQPELNKSVSPGRIDPKRCAGSPDQTPASREFSKYTGKPAAFAFRAEVRAERINLLQCNRVLIRRLSVLRKGLMHIERPKANAIGETFLILLLGGIDSAYETSGYFNDVSVSP